MDAVNDVLKAAGEALISAKTVAQNDLQTDTPPSHESFIELSEDDIIFNVRTEDTGPRPQTAPSAAKRSYPPTVPNPAVVKLKKRITALGRRDADVSLQRPAGPLPKKGQRDDDFVLFSTATLQKVKGDFSTHTYRNDEEISETLLDLHALTHGKNETTFETPSHEVIDDVLPVSTISEPPVSPLVKKGKWAHRVGIIGLAFISAAVGAALYSAFASGSSGIEQSVREKDARIAALQQQYDELVALIAAADLGSVSKLQRQLNETREELALLKQEKSATPEEPSEGSSFAPQEDHEAHRQLPKIHRQQAMSAENDNASDQAPIVQAR